MNVKVKWGNLSIYNLRCLEKSHVVHNAWQKQSFPKTTNVLDLHKRVGEGSEVLLKFQSVVDFERGEEGETMCCWMLVFTTFWNIVVWLSAAAIVAQENPKAVQLQWQWQEEWGWGGGGVLRIRDCGLESGYDVVVCCCSVDERRAVLVGIGAATNQEKITQLVSP